MPWSGATPALSYTSYTVLRAPMAAGGEQWEYWEHWVSAALWLLSSAPWLGHRGTDCLPVHFFSHWSD